MRRKHSRHSAASSCNVMKPLCLVLLFLAQLTWSSASEADGCEWRYFQHYEAKGCKPIIGPDGCPVRYDCKPIPEEDRKVCLDKGKRYRVGDRIENVGPCDHCMCVDEGGATDAYVTCAAVDCPDWEPRNKSCYMGYGENDCCPKEICPPSDSSLRITCQHKGKTYDVGRYIPLDDDFCRSCICTERWNGTKGPGCQAIDCLTSQYVRELRGGCVPIYYERGCCPRDVYCDEVYGSSPVAPDQNNKDNLCQYNGQYYKLGSTVYMKYRNSKCVSCTCKVPPDFTCVEQACKSPPSNDCKIVLPPGKCCPTYNCPLNPRLFRDAQVMKKK